MTAIVRFLPKNHLSYLLGWLASIPLPSFLAEWIIGIYSRSYRVDMSEVEPPARPYPSVASFFVRELKQGVRPVGMGIVSPVDGTLRSCGRITADRLPQVKGKSYSVADLLGSNEHAVRFQGGTFFNLYLSPRDYHHIHFPVSGNIIESTYIPGALWPVNNWSLASIDNLFGINERVVTMIDCPEGRVAVVMVGATNVGKMALTYDDYVARAYPSFAHAASGPIVRTYPENLPCTAGGKLGTFFLGSSVVMLFEHQWNLEIAAEWIQGEHAVRYGQSLAEVRG